jgi:hypothetical protein
MDELTNSLNKLNLEFSQRGGELLYDDENYEYKIGYKCKTKSKITWRCTTSNCCARVWTFGFEKPVYREDTTENHFHEAPIKKKKIREAIRIFLIRLKLIRINFLTLT